MSRIVHQVASRVPEIRPPTKVAEPLGIWQSPEFWTAVGTGVLALATLVLIGIGVSQVHALKRQNRRWQTLAACDRYNFDPILDSCLKTLRTAKQENKFNGNESNYRLEITTIINYLDGIAIGIYQGLYIEDLARDHLHHVVIGHVNEYLRDGMPKKIDVSVLEFQFVLALADRWTKISRPRFSERQWKLPWSKAL